MVFITPRWGVATRMRPVDPALLPPHGVQRLREQLVRLPELATEDTRSPESGATAVTLPSRASVRVGTEFRLRILAANPVDRPPVSVSVGVLFPDRNTVRFVVAPGAVSDAVALSTLQGPVPLWLLEGGSQVTKSSLLSFVVPPGVPAGTYYWFVVLTQPPGPGADMADWGVTVTGVAKVQLGELWATRS